jgi:hypothetical protein
VQCLKFYPWCDPCYTLPVSEEPIDDAPTVDTGCPICTRKPLHHMHDVISGEGIMAVIGARQELDEAGGVWPADDPMLLNDYAGLKHTFTDKMSDTKTLELHTLTEAKHHLEAFIGEGDRGRASHLEGSWYLEA